MTELHNKLDINYIVKLINLIFFLNSLEPIQMFISPTVTHIVRFIVMLFIVP